MAGADPKLGALIGAAAEKSLAHGAPGTPWTEALRADLREAIAAGRMPSLEAAARTMGCGPRTLQRRLAEHGLRWRELVDEARISRARELLADPRLGLAQIGHQAGFSQASAFHRAFRRIVGTTPRRHRLILAAAEQRR
jgi:AraC-like DNA-binding protein